MRILQFFFWFYSIPFVGNGFLIHPISIKPRSLMSGSSKYYQRVGNFRKCRVLFKVDAVGILSFRTLYRNQGRGRTLCDAWHFFRIRIIHRNVTSHPSNSFHKAKTWRFDYRGFSSICKPSSSCPFILRIERCCRTISSTFGAKHSAKENGLVLF